MSEKEQKKKEKELKNAADGAERTSGQSVPEQVGHGKSGGESVSEQAGYGKSVEQSVSEQPEYGKSVEQSVSGQAGLRQPGLQNAQNGSGYGGRVQQNPQGQQPGPGGYGYQNPYQNNWQNQRYYGNDYSRRDWSGYNNYPNQNYGNMPQGNPYGWQGGYQPGNYGPQGSAGNSDNGDKKKAGAGKKVLLAVCISALLVFCAGGIYFVVNMFDSGAEEEVQQAAAQPQNPQIGQVDLDSPEDDAKGDTAKQAQGNLTDVSDLVEKIMPSVVSVNAVYTYSSYYWDDEKYDGGGSGFIIGENETELLIATNSHVVADSEDLTVAFVDEEKADAMVKGYDNDLDVAVIAVRLQDIPEETKKEIAVARLGDSTTLRAGQAVISIGNALLLGQSVTTGIISATNAPVGGGYDEMGNQYGSDDRVMIQTTAIMNPGCSGGVLINSAGEVIGINTMTISAIDVEGMCYAIPISDAIPILDNLKKREIRERLREEDSGFLGISCSNVERRDAEEYGIPDGVYVREVDEDGPADNAGIRKGDVIVALDEVKVGTMNELSEMLRYYPVGEIVDVEIMRYEGGEYKSQTVSVKLGRK